MVQWLRFCAPNAGHLGSIPDQGIRSHMLQLGVPVRQRATVACCNQGLAQPDKFFFKNFDNDTKKEFLKNSLSLLERELT